MLPSNTVFILLDYILYLALDSCPYCNCSTAMHLCRVNREVHRSCTVRARELLLYLAGCKKTNRDTGNLSNSFQSQFVLGVERNAPWSCTCKVRNHKIKKSGQINYFTLPAGVQTKTPETVSLLPPAIRICSKPSTSGQRPVREAFPRVDHSHRLRAFP